MSNETYVALPLDQVDCRPQVRTEFDPERMDGLAESVRAQGVLQPIRVRRAGDRYVVVTGERRVRAARQAGLSTVPALVEGGDAEAGNVLLGQLTENVQRQDLRPLELAAALRLLIQTTGWTAAAAAQRLGLSPASVSRSLALLDAPAWLQAKVAAGEIAPSAAYELARVDDPGRQAEMAARLTEGSLTRDGVRGTRRAGAAGTGSASAAAKRVVVPLDATRSITLTGGCPSLEAMIEWLEDALGRARRVRQQGVALATFVKMLHDQLNGH